MLIKDLRQKSIIELKSLIEDLKAELFMLRFRNSTGQLEHPHKISLIKKDIARIFTIMNDLDYLKEQEKKATKIKQKVGN